MFESLGDRLQSVFARLKGHGRLTEKDIDAAMREIRIALLEADVNFKVVKDFISRVSEKAVGEEVAKSITPAQKVVKIVYDEISEILGGESKPLKFSAQPPSVTMLVGLQGSGKTTVAAKLAYFLRHHGRNPVLVAADLYRPAAVEQLKTLGEQIDTPVYYYRHVGAVDIAKRAVVESRKNGNDVVIVDTAGRLHIDEEMMEELVEMKKELQPAETLLVVDAMTGQDAVNVALSFLEKLDFDGIVLTKLDGDARGGAALSMKSVTGKPVKLASIGEKMDDLETFHPERIASRILGMGDVVTLVEKTEQVVDEERAKKLEEKLRKQKFDLEDFLDQLQQMQKMGGLSKILELTPGMGQMARSSGIEVDEKKIKRIEAIVRSMTTEERRNPNILNASRRRRIATGSGTSTQEVNQLMRQFAQMQKMLKVFSGKGPGPGLLKKLFPF
ncbi:MAG: signal recognition particle protein [Actinomycetota bacterium]|nr:signal recognition particle protein [Actinomycetota bacterium]